MYVVLNRAGAQVFRGCLSDSTKYILSQYGPLDLAIRAGIRIVPLAATHLTMTGLL